MQFIVLVYNDPALLAALPEGEADSMMRGCLAHADALRREGKLLQSRMLAEADTARTVRVRNGRMAAFDGPFAEAKEVLGGFNLIEAADMDEAVEIASHFPWAQTGSVEVRAVQDIGAVRRRVGAQPAEHELDAVIAA
jgi:hypothetical protein